MTRRNDKRSNTPELPPFAQMLFGAILGKGVDMIAKKMAEIAEEETPDIHAEGISNQDVTNINNGKATLSKLRIPADGSAVEYPIPDNLQFFFDEEDDDWKPNFRDNSKKWSICKYICYSTQCSIELNEGNVYFKSADLADEAIRLMGKESLDDLFSTDW